MKPPLRLRDFVEDGDGWLYAVAANDDAVRAGCVLRYVPDPAGDRVRRGRGIRYRKLDFVEAWALTNFPRAFFVSELAKFRGVVERTGVRMEQ